MKKLKVSDIVEMVQQKEWLLEENTRIANILADQCWHPKRFIIQGDWYRTNSDWDRFGWYQRNTTCNACNRSVIKETKGEGSGAYKRELLNGYTAKAAERDGVW